MYLQQISRKYIIGKIRCNCYGELRIPIITHIAYIVVLHTHRIRRARNTKSRNNIAIPPVPLRPPHFPKDRCQTTRHEWLIRVVIQKREMCFWFFFSLYLCDLYSSMVTTWWRLWWTTDRPYHISTPFLRVLYDRSTVITLQPNTMRCFCPSVRIRTVMMGRRWSVNYINGWMQQTISTLGPEHSTSSTTIRSKLRVYATEWWWFILAIELSS